MKDIIVLLPGIMGSALKKDSAMIWDTSISAVGRALFSRGENVRGLALNTDNPNGEDVTASHLLDDVHIVPFFWKIDGYSGLSRYIQTKFGVTPGENFFEFPYDWRLDNRISAKRLANAAAEWLDGQRRRHPDARLVIIGHSMGGLVARYFIEVLGGWRDTRMLVTLGTPHRGSVKALDFLANGLRQRLGSVTLVELTDLIQSLPSVYQLLPIYACVGETADSLRRLEDIDRRTIGLLDVARAREGIAFHREIELAVKTNRQEAGYGYRMIPVVGTFQPTFLSALLRNDGVEPLKTYKGETMLYGDGTVPRLSATPIEMSNTGSETFVPCPHASLQNFDPVRLQLRALLQDRDISELKAVDAQSISLELSDAFVAGEASVIRARYLGSVDPLRARIINLDSTVITEQEFVQTDDPEGWQQLDNSTLGPGMYKICVEADEMAEPIEDFFSVVA